MLKEPWGSNTWSIQWHWDALLSPSLLRLSACGVYVLHVGPLTVTLTRRIE